MLFGLLTTEEKPLIVELYEYIKNKYFTIDGDGYENFSPGEGTLVSLDLVIIGILVGIIIASFFAVYNKRVLGEFVRTLIREKCNSPESAKTLEELGFEKNTFVRSSLRSGVTLRRVVKCVEEEEYLAAFMTAPDDAESGENIESGVNSESGVNIESGENALNVSGASFPEEPGTSDESSASFSEEPGANDESSASFSEEPGANDASSANVKSGASEASNAPEVALSDGDGEASSNEKSDADYRENSARVGKTAHIAESGASNNFSTVAEVIDESEEIDSEVGEISQISSENPQLVGKSAKNTQGIAFPPYKIDLASDHFYIPEKDVYTAEIKFEKKGTSWIGILLTVIIVTGFAIMLIHWMPNILQFIDNAISGLNGN